MQLSLNTNSLSILVQNSLSNSTNRLNTCIERLTTGYKINHAKDNAANYSISTSMGSELSSYNVAQDNVSMGIDLITTATDSLDLVTTHLQRIRDLAEQAANGTYGEDSLAAIQSEITARKAEINRIFDNTEYNGITLFRTSGSTFIEKVDAQSQSEAVDEGYTVITTADQLQSMKLDGKYILMNDIDLSGYDWTAIGTLNNPFTGTFDGNGYSIKNLTVAGGDYQGLFGRIEYAEISNVAIVDANVSGGRYVGALAGYSFNSTVTNCYAKGTVTGYSAVGGLVGYSAGTDEDHYSQISECYSDAVVTATDSRAGGLVGINTMHSEVDYSFSKSSVNGSSEVGGLTGENSSGGQISQSYSTGSVSGSTNTGAFTGKVEGNDSKISDCYWDTEKSGSDVGIASGSTSGVSGLDTDALTELVMDNDLPGSTLVEEEQETEITFQVGIHSDSSSQISIDTAFNFSMSGISATSSAAARKALNKVDKLLDIVNAKQTEYGASYNRLESALETINVSIDNLTSSQSTIRDADIAEVSSEYIRNQILQQASATLLATANQSPSLALQLI